MHLLKERINCPGVPGTGELPERHVKSLDTSTHSYIFYKCKMG